LRPVELRDAEYGSAFVQAALSTDVGLCTQELLPIVAILCHQID